MTNTEPFPLTVDPRFLKCLDQTAKETGTATFPCRVILQFDRFDIATGPAYDPEQDFLLRGKRCRAFVNKQEARRYAGWKLGTVVTIGVREAPRLKSPTSRSTASNRGRLKMDRALVRTVHHELSGWSGWLWRLRDMFGDQVQVEGTFDWIANDIDNGDARPATVLQVEPKVIVAAYSDDFDCVIGLRFPRRLARTHGLQPGDRLISCNNYGAQGEPVSDITVGRHALNTSWSNFRPVIGNFVSSDHERLKSLEIDLPATQWRRTEKLGAEWFHRFQNGEVSPRIGAPLWAYAPADEPPLTHVPIGERCIAALFDIMLVTSITVLIFWFFLGFDDVFWKYMSAKGNPLARKHFLEVRSLIQMYSAFGFIISSALLTWSPLQATIGKTILGLKVVSTKEGSRRVSLYQAVKRSIFVIAGLWGFFRPAQRPFHDKVSSTLVVRNIK